MSRVLPWDDSEGASQTTLEQRVAVTTKQIQPTEHSAPEIALDDNALKDTTLLAEASQLSAKAKVALIRTLITQLETNHIQTILESGLREIADRDRRSLPSVSVSRHTRLLLKKDYSYQDRGLSQPTQYYVYLRRRKPKLDRYIGTLFYIPDGCALSYALDAAERIVFHPPHNVFQLQDMANPDRVQVVRLLHLEPPPPDYTFDKQQHDTPAIYLHLEYLDPATDQPLNRQRYAFPTCMYEGGELDRYRWQVSPVRREVEPLSPQPPAMPTVIVAPSTATTISPARRVLEVPVTKALTFHLANSAEANAVLKRMRLWVAWSEKAIPHSRWEIVQEGDVYTLMNAHFNRRILKFSANQAAIALENSLPVLIKWFHDLSLAVSQAQNQRLYSAAQLKLAHTMFVDMNLPQPNPAIVLKKLFGVEFV